MNDEKRSKLQQALENAKALADEQGYGMVLLLSEKDEGGESGICIHLTKDSDEKVLQVATLAHHILTGNIPESVVEDLLGKAQLVDDLREKLGQDGLVKLDEAMGEALRKASGAESDPNLN